MIDWINIVLHLIRWVITHLVPQAPTFTPQVHDFLSRVR
jgi:hypothetical protein